MTSRVEAVAEILWHRYSPDHEDSWPSPNADEYRRVASDILSTLTTEPAAPEGRQEAARIGDAVLDWMVKFDLLDAGNEYYVSDVLAVLNDLTPSTRHAEQAVTEAMVKAACVATNIGFRDFHVPESVIRRALTAALAQKEEGR